MPRWRRGLAALNMALAYDSTSGNLLYGASGLLMDGCCCEEECVGFFYARRCYDDVLTNWSLPCPLSVPFYARKESNGVCYKFVDPPVDDAGGIDFGASTTLEDCSDESCTDEIPPDPLPPDDHVPFDLCTEVAAAGLAYPSVQLTSGGNFTCPDVTDPTTEPAFTGKMYWTGSSWNSVSEDTPAEFGGKLIAGASVGCIDKGSLGFEDAGGWSLQISMFANYGSALYSYKKEGGSTPAGVYTLTPPEAPCPTIGDPTGTAPATMTVG